MSAPRLFGIPACDAPVVAVLRRGPSDWCHLGKWTVGPRPAYEPGAWLPARLYPQRCDLSPDGRWLSYFALNGGADWAAGTTYYAVSRLPWAHALAAWGTDGTWTLGLRFTDDAVWEVGPPDHGDAEPVRSRHGLALVRSVTYSVERRHGWAETADTPAYDPADPWEIRRAPLITMAKNQPGRSLRLEVSGAYAAFRAFDTETYGPAVYRISGPDDSPVRDLPDVQWADWSATGDLLVATVDGRLQVRSGDDGSVEWEADLARLEPSPEPPPPDATRW